MKIISVKAAKEALEKREAIFVDIRDPASYQDDHIPGAIHVSGFSLG